MKDDRETFSKSIEYIINVDGLNKTAKSQNLYNLSSIHKTDNLSSNSGRATYSDDFVKINCKNIDIGQGIVYN